jgi:hypothetical protein
MTLPHDESLLRCARNDGLVRNDRLVRNDDRLTGERAMDSECLASVIDMQFNA